MMYRFPNFNNNRSKRGLMTRSSYKNTYIITQKEFFGVVLVTPEISISNVSMYKISDEVGKNTCSVLFTCSAYVSQWEARATNETITPEYGAGLLIGSGTNVNPDTETSFDVDYSELTQGDRVYTIRIYVQVEGSWY